MLNQWKQRLTYASAIILTVVIAASAPLSGRTETAEELQSKINERSNQIKQLEEEIRQYNLEVDKASSEAKTLQSTIKTIDLTQKKITTDLTLTSSKITKTNLTIEQLTNKISEAERNISQNKKALASLIRSTRETEDRHLVSLVLSSRNIQDMWDDLDATRQIQTSLKEKSDELRLLKSELSARTEDLTGQKVQLVGLQQDLVGKKQAAEATKQEKSTLLAETKNQEVTFKKLVADREAKKAAFEKELYEFESQLHLLIDPSSYPQPKRGILSWPLDKVYVTQMFGKTVGAEKLYLSGSHNGVDFRASVGTRVLAVLEGEVAGTGNTDIYPGCYSFGKWVMIKHPNGLSSIYGHLSAINVSASQKVSAGDVIGYSGNTGYSTGPHLHLGLYATQGVRIEKYVNSIGCKQAVIPLADIKAYLDPMVYLPEY